MFQASGGDIFDFINIKLGGKRGKLLLQLTMINNNLLIVINFNVLIPCKYD